ncbi:hypothetical protein GCM10022631_18540 [Deinococcus rubellus]|uniref:Uncharacterized protein n=1 Tax=Deinococcus rubellus TaxID=1889240 RepID=A0ABY5YHK7_9DEIO|nr:hypothetical protein [Deinococcus rubellus]UWX63651.1 hypothetical protein N0D28_13080 [Deinococcus rubellus]
MARLKGNNSGGGGLAWIIGIIVVLVLLYLLYRFYLQPNGLLDLGF